MNDTAISTRLMFLGSSFDGLGVPILFDREHKTHLEISDVDVMMELSPPCYPAVKYRRESEATTEAALLVDGRGCHPGYVKLVIQGEHFLFDVPGILDHGTICMSNKFMQVFIQDPVLRKGTLENILERAEVTFNGPAVSFRLPLISGVERNIVLTGDIVGSFPWNKWPHEADEWLSRERTSGWPNADQTKAVEELGCYLVPVANPGDKDCRTEWRISFVLAERHLASSFNQAQRHVYRIIKLIHKHRLGDLGVLSTYHLKTTLFWLCERIPQDRWTDEEMGQRFFDFFDLLLGFLSTKSIPNYFIPENNMIDYMEEQLVNENVKILQDILLDPKTILEEIQARYDLHFDPLKYLFSEMPLGNLFQTCALTPELDIERGSLDDAFDATREMFNELSEKHPDSLLRPILKLVDAFPGNAQDNIFRQMRGGFKEAVENCTREAMDLMADKLSGVFKPLSDVVRNQMKTYEIDDAIEFYSKILDLALDSDSDQEQIQEYNANQEAASREILYLRNQECDDHHNAKRESFDSLDENKIAGNKEHRLLEFARKPAYQLEELDLD
ncbi:uncharacterized protein LOC106157491 [Lingula anatina]|uniref:Uncharacterized protein LOC106157491 n=1 Tax=Lingula anatina TaxID=7574 RepID=A0A1S3HST6_LINAN|nr:uncharacterized protein LOC106157491 [Lingula anatina]|eukprot:XP_013388616.1 uncharacterized protein LOC106157491 [Lingula anatina]